MDYNGFLCIKGQVGPHNVAISEGRHKGKIPILGFEQTLAETPGLSLPQTATGSAVYSLVVTKRVDAATPVFIKAMCDGARFDGIQLELYAPGPEDTAALAYTIALGETYIHEIQHQPSETDAEALETAEQIERVCLLANVIRWRDEPAGIETEARMSVHGPGIPG